jgi:hypothetical protein
MKNACPERSRDALVIINTPSEQVGPSHGKLSLSGRHGKVNETQEGGRFLVHTSVRMPFYAGDWCCVLVPIEPSKLLSMNEKRSNNSRGKRHTAGETREIVSVAEREEHGKEQSTKATTMFLPASTRHTLPSPECGSPMAEWQC